MMLKPVPQHFRKLSDEDWTSILLRSVDDRVVDGVEFPSFPPASLQENFVGSSYATALKEAAAFYAFVKNESIRLGVPLAKGSKLLDFGCGWGRFLRFFWRDVDPPDLVGVDTDPDILEVCRETRVPAVLSHIDPLGHLDLPDASQSHIVAYSVFTHLPEHVQHHWLRELSRVARPGCVFVCTVEPRRFLTFVAEIPSDAASAWHQGLRRVAGDIDDKLRRFDADEFVYLPSGGGNYRDASVYGDAVIPRAYIEREWSKYFVVRKYDENRFWQAAVVLQKRRTMPGGELAALLGRLARSALSRV
jgi:SAM-dependent methyltransferase